MIDTYVYHIDRDNRLTAVGSNWDEFLRANAGDPSSASAAVIGRSLFDFISGLDTIQLYHLLLKKVRSTGRTATVLLNCDSPTVRRKMRLLMQPGADDAVVFRSAVLATAPRDPLDLLRGDVTHDSGFVTICSFCKRLALPEQTWVDAETFVGASAHFLKDAPPRLTHGVCPDCYRAALEELSQLG